MKLGDGVSNNVFGFGKKKPPAKRSRTETKDAKSKADLENALGLERHFSILKDAEIESLKNRIAYLEETITVLRDCLGAKQMTANVHSAEGKILLNDLQAKAVPANGYSPIHR